MQETGLTCAIMILNWNGASWLARCLPSVVEAAQQANAAVWVVDNASQDESEALVRRDFPQVTYFQVGANKVLVGYNDAVRHYDGDTVLFLNNDIIVAPDFVLPLLQRLKTTPECFAVAPCVKSFPPMPDSPVEMAAEEPVFTQGMLRGQALNANKSGATRFTIGGAMLCWRNLFLELGGFDALYLPGYHEDIDLSWRAWKRGWCCWYEPESVVYHAGGSSMGRSEKVRVMQARNEFLFHWANLTVPRLVFRHGATLLPRLALAVVKRDRTRLLGFVQALSRCRQALQSRRRNRTLARLDDLQALQRIRDLQESPPVLPGGINIP